MMRRMLPLLLFLLSTAAFSQDNADNTAIVGQGLISLEEFVSGLKSRNESIKDAESVNVMVNDLLIENLKDYKIDPKNISKMEILVLEPNDAQRRRKPSIIITTKRK